VDQARKIVEQYTPQAYAIAFRLTGNQQEAWDLVQNAMLRVLRSYGTFDPTYKVEQWLYAIVRNLYLDRLRMEGRRKEDPLDEPAHEGALSHAERLVDSSPRPDEVLDRESDRDEVQKALSELPADLRMAVVLVDMEGESYEDAARILQIPVSTLGVRVFRARKSLKAKLAHRVKA
jgi:RNA polymerase sigma-70 factor (ECF subfamily)